MPLIITIALRPLSNKALADVQSNHADTLQLAAHPKRRQEQQLGRYIRRQVLADYLAIDSEQLIFAQHPLGKPYLLSTPQVEFSQSHCTDQFILVCNLQGVAMGVDIETKHRSINTQALAMRILTDNELKEFKQAKHQQAFLLKVWTIKEAILKAAGLGIRLNLNELESGLTAQLTAPLPTQLTGQLRMTDEAGQVQHNQLGKFAYQCFEAAHHYYSVAWIHSPLTLVPQDVVFEYLV